MADIREERKEEQPKQPDCGKKEQPAAKTAAEVKQPETETGEAAELKETADPAEEVEKTAEEQSAAVVETPQAETVSKPVEKADRKEVLAHAEEKGRAFLSKIFEEMKLDVTIDVKEKNGYLVFDLKGKNLGILIGRRGDTLDSLQFLLNLVINEKNTAKVKGIIDIEHYRAKREETLIGLSHKLAAKARKTGQKVVLEPMNPQERRIIHMALQNDRRVSTYSEGEEPYRKVVIVPEVKENNRRKDSNQE